MGASVPVDHDSGLEVDWRRHQSASEGLQKQQHDNEGLQHVHVPYPGAGSDKFIGHTTRRILGLSIGMFWLVVALIVLVLAGGIGGGVAGGLAAQKNSCSHTQSSMSTSATAASVTSALPSSSTSSSTSSAATSGPSPQISTPCTGNNAANGSTLIANDPSGSNTAIGNIPHSFLILCNTNYPAGSAYGNPSLIDLFRLYTPDMAGCIAACAEYNIGYAVTGGGPRCASVAVVKAAGEFCYLKSATGVNNTSSSGGTPIDSAILID